MQNREWYRDWFNSPHYHKLYFQRNEGEAAAAIDRLVDELGLPPGARVLDAACGKGRHSRHLAARGFDVTGIDIAAESIAEAAESEGDNLHFFVHDMRLPFWINYYDCVFNFFTSFGYFATQREHDDALMTLVRSLKPGGRLVIDYLNAEAVSKALKPKEKQEIDGTHYTIERWQDDTHFHKRIRVEDAALAQPMEHTEKVAKFRLSDFEKMLRKQNADVLHTFGNYDLSEYTADAPRLIIVAKKAINESLGESV